MAHVADTQHGTFLVPGKATSPFVLAEGHKVTGADWVEADQAWPCRQRRNAPDGRSARLRATRPTDGAVTVMLADTPGEQRFSLRCCATSLQATRFLRLWARRHWSAQVFRTLKRL